MKYKGTELAKGSKALELYEEARYSKDAAKRKAAEKKLKEHMKQLDLAYLALHGQVTEDWKIGDEYK